MKSVNDYINARDFAGLREFLAAHPELVDAGIGIGDQGDRKAHPLHRLADRVAAGRLDEAEALAFAGIYLDAGALVDGENIPPGQDTPLTAAISLHTDRLALLYLDNGADIFHPGCHGGTPLHWAAWCGSPVVLARLIRDGAEINKLCRDFKSTPLFWAVHGLTFGGEENRRGQAECIRLLLENGADKSIPNFEGYLPVQLLGGENGELVNLFT